MLQDAIKTYQEMLTDDLAAESQAVLDVLQPKHNLGFGDRPLCTVLRPRFLSAAQYRFLQERVRVLLRAFNHCQVAARADAGFRAQFRLTEPEETLFALDPGFPCPMPTSRLDAFFVSEEELFFTEFNAETPAGAGYSDVLAEVFLGLPIMNAFLRHYRLTPVPVRPGVLHALLDSYRRFAGRSERPRIGILDWKEVPTYNEFLIFERYFHSQGLECRIVDPREVELRDGKLWAGDYHVQLIYKRVLVSELLERGGFDHPVVRAVREGAVCMVNPFCCKALYKKASLAVLSDERNSHLFDAMEQNVIVQNIPWTRVVEERKTTIDGQPIDLVPFILQHRERFVLKPNDDYGGKGIVLGWTVEDAQWEEAVRTALATPYIVQQRVRLPEESFPSLVEGKAVWSERKLDTAPYVCHGEYMDGSLTRISTDPLLNVTAGGGSTVPTFVIERRV